MFLPPGNWVKLRPMIFLLWTWLKMRMLLASRSHGIYRGGRPCGAPWSIQAHKIWTSKMSLDSKDFTSIRMKWIVKLWGLWIKMLGWCDGLENFICGWSHSVISAPHFSMWSLTRSFERNLAFDLITLKFNDILIINFFKIYSIGFKRFGECKSWPLSDHGLTRLKGAAWIKDSPFGVKLRKTAPYFYVVPFISYPDLLIVTSPSGLGSFH